MAKKIRRVRTFARTATKSMEKSLIENAKKLSKDPYLILPEYKDNHSRKYFGKIEKNLDKVHRFNDEPKKLEKLSKKRGLDGALAGTLLIAHSEKAPYLAVAKFSTGDVTYAQRGNADKEKLIAVQHFDDPVLRLLGLKDITLKKRLHVYSWDKGFVSTGLEPRPPKEFVDFVINKIGFSSKNGVAVCGHIGIKSVKNKEFLEKYYLRIHWKSADAVIAICEDCVKTTKNTMFNVTRYLLEPDLSNDFSIDVVGEVVKHKEPGYEPQTFYINEYLSGEFTDREFIRKNVEQREKMIKQSGEKLLILDGVSYGKDVEGFIKALKPNRFERKGLEFILEQIEEPVVLSNVTPNKVLERYWEKHGLDAINSILDDIKMTEKFFSLDDTPSNILEVVFKYEERQQILSQLPKYESLPPLARFADHIARTYKTFGEKKTLGEIKKRPDNPKGKSLAYAFLLVFGKGADKKWQYSPVEIEYGEFLKEYAKKLFDSQPKNYHKTLQELLATCGSTEKI
jgi:hypothetical protein